jgi:hypothetical protein
MNDTEYTRISFYRKDLFSVVPAGFIAQSIGSLWCKGWVMTERLDQLRQNNIWVDTENI